jgi:hydrogenase/urease accessory protein HupE
MRLIVFLIGFMATIFASLASAHEVRPAYLELRQADPETYALLFKVPARGDELRLALYVSLPYGTQDVITPRASFEGGAHIERRIVKRAGGLNGQRIAIEGLSATLTDVLVRVEGLDGTTQTERLTPTTTSFMIKPAPSVGDVAITYLTLGVEHILLGFDHLLFVLALVILVRNWRRVAITVTAFTVAHSITLAAATLGFVHVPGPPVEATIALSIMLIAAEIINARRGRPSLTLRWPWLVAFAFGLLHGLGFANALAEVGLPQHAIPLALLFFNLGVEMGQLAFVAAVMLLASAVQWIASQRFHAAALMRASFAWIDAMAAYAIGVMAAYWLIERTTGFWS